MLIFLLTYLCSVKPQREKKPKSKKLKCHTLLIEKFHLELFTELSILGVLPNMKNLFFHLIIDF